MRFADANQSRALAAFRSGGCACDAACAREAVNVSDSARRAFRRFSAAERTQTRVGAIGALGAHRVRMRTHVHPRDDTPERIGGDAFSAAA
ncbi:hypothetical protein A8H35_01785 [Burkholderia thailandensis]|uniref:Uncharacterized protein n=1 Tax=Burkholderia thailandensis (strain ATCC 700388 / DSM 13276 / CCUG 48851 / CIP 106301 / E264) TaxID=271848 RepID=Q2T0E5_BURTA|nr:hypothetical protein BTH_I0798 [Burkholderia thailandensis E264]AOJ44497.1 hypothetical protein WJ27_04860 [Burkholderia thailandensis]AVR09917.1 hypothetical protein A8H31_21435 [Burkholderia thailandensis]AWY57358.1 hypothetical protein A8H35_01785 [Burkholderia thailandensis]AWY68484.1 hypothetical protein A8H36_26590 [Burkholderia thailandensis]